MRKQYAPEKQSHGKKINIIAIELAVCVILTAVLVGTVIGKYWQQFNSYGSVRALDFYFTSDFLDGETHALAPEATELSFTLGNHADDLRCSEMDITYEVTVEKVGEASGSNPTINGGSGTLTKNEVKDGTVTISGLTSGTYTITAVGTGKNTDSGASGYVKTLTATITIPAKTAEVYYHKETTAEYILLTVWNEGDVDGNVTITYTGIPDNTNPNMTNWKEGSNDTPASENIPIAPYESKVFRFFGGSVDVTGAIAGTPN